jgi:capsule polysaccharide modification protein KpsS
MSSQELKVFINCNSYDGTPLDGAMFIDKIAKKLRDHNISTVGIYTHFKEVKDYFDKKGMQCYYLPDFKKKYPVHDLAEELRGVEQRYDANLEKILVGDYDQYHSNRRKALETLLSVFRFWEDVIDREKPDYIIGGGVRFLDLVAHAICKKRKTKFLAVQIPLFPNTFCFTQDILGHTSTLDRYWQLNKDKEITKGEREKVEEYIKSIIGTEKRPFRVDSRPIINPAKIKFFLEKAYKSFFIERLRTPYSKPWRGAYRYAMKIIRSKLSRVLYSKPDYNEKYIFYPLHVEWDSVILLWNPLFLNQLFLIKHISRNLPSDTTLYVKEHPNDVGGISLTQLKRIKDTPKVKLVHPQEDSHKLIRNSEAVLVIAGTPGWEGLLMDKPVICVGETYYNSLGLTWDVKDLTQLQEIIKKATKEDKTNRDRLYRFISAFQKVVYPGKINFTQLYYTNEINRDIVLSEENIKKVAEGIRKQLTEDSYLLGG